MFFRASHRGKQRFRATIPAFERQRVASRSAGSVLSIWPGGWSIASRCRKSIEEAGKAKIRTLDACHVVKLWQRDARSDCGQPRFAQRGERSVAAFRRAGCQAGGIECGDGGGRRGGGAAQEAAEGKRSVAWRRRRAGRRPRCCAELTAPVGCRPQSSRRRDRTAPDCWATRIVPWSRPCSAAARCADPRLR